MSAYITYTLRYSEAVLLFLREYYFIRFDYMSTNNVHTYFKHYYNNGIHLVFKYLFNDAGIGPLVMGHKMHHHRLCSLSNLLGMWHPLTVLLMIFIFKDGLLI